MVVAPQLSLFALSVVPVNELTVLLLQQVVRCADGFGRCIVFRDHLSQVVELQVQLFLLLLKHYVAGLARLLDA